ncbi:hypothetical protein BDV93DRAFT_528773 [Ceratobasidium sp. AG-I]|nr:hypothetical protein BDV93DRAFT_528773 [Ceratobasidium sp. AG-I]
MAPRTKQLTASGSRKPGHKTPRTGAKTPRKTTVAAKRPVKKKPIQPTLIHRVEFGKCSLLDGLVQQEDEVEWEEEEKNISDDEDPDERMFLRVANSFAFFRETTKGTQMVPAIELEEADVHLVAWVGSLSGGARRVSLKLSGHIPPLEIRENRDKRVWGDDSQVVRVRVAKLECVRRAVLLFKAQCTWVIAADGRSAYMLQNPWHEYEDAWQATREHYHAHGKPLPVWQDVRLGAARPVWANVWAIWMLRLENGYPVDHDDDPDTPNLEEAVKALEKKKSNKGKRGGKRRRSGASASKTRAKGKGKGKARESDGESNAGSDVDMVGADEVGLSDATSVTRDDEDEIPTGPTWRFGDPVQWRAWKADELVGSVRRPRYVPAPKPAELAKMGSWNLGSDGWPPPELGQKVPMDVDPENGSGAGAEKDPEVGPEEEGNPDAGPEDEEDPDAGPEDEEDPDAGSDKEGNPDAGPEKDGNPDENPNVDPDENPGVGPQENPNVGPEDSTNARPETDVEMAESEGGPPKDKEQPDAAPASPSTRTATTPPAPTAPESQANTPSTERVAPVTQEVEAARANAAPLHSPTPQPDSQDGTRSGGAAVTERATSPRAPSAADPPPGSGVEPDGASNPAGGAPASTAPDVPAQPLLSDSNNAASALPSSTPAPELQPVVQPPSTSAATPPRPLRRPGGPDAP